MKGSSGFDALMDDDDDDDEESDDEKETKKTKVGLACDDWICIDFFSCGRPHHPQP